MLVSDLRLKTDKELNELIDDLKAELFMLRFKNSTGQLDKPHKISAVKKDIARVYTVLQEHKRGISIKTTSTKKIKNTIQKTKVKESQPTTKNEVEVKLIDTDKKTITTKGDK